jgi:hypothetical protein
LANEFGVKYTSLNAFTYVELFDHIVFAIISRDECRINWCKYASDKLSSVDALELEDACDSSASNNGSLFPTIINVNDMAIL